MSPATEVVCPKCKSSRYRLSRWHSYDEKHAHPHASAYRCLNCSHRFIVDHVAPARSRPVFVLAALVVVVAVAVVGALGLDGVRLAAPEPGAESVDSVTMQRAQAGDADAQLKMARLLLLDAEFNPASTKEAVEWLRQAVEGGNTAAMVELGRVYRTGVGVLQDYQQATRWIERAALEGDAEGMLELGRLYREGVLLERDPVLAYVWFNRAATALNMTAVRERDEIARQLSPTELAEGQRRSAEPVATAAPR